MSLKKFMMKSSSSSDSKDINTRFSSMTISTEKHERRDSNQFTYTAEKVVGNGSFGVVFKAVIDGTGEVVAIKKVLQDPRFKNRELQMMKLLNHPNVVSLKHCFDSSGEKPGETYLNLVMEYIPDTIYRVCRTHVKASQSVPLLHVKLYSYQLCRAIHYIHTMNVCHRDIKPQNLLVDTNTHVLKLCDFGSAKSLVVGEPNVSYICSRYYRAPELIFGATDYTHAIDLWSVGCVVAELLLGEPLFPGESGVDQLVEVIKIVGTPTHEEIYAMNKDYKDFSFPAIEPHPWTQVFANSKAPAEAISFISQLLVYNPSKRIKPLEACCHPFFDSLRDPQTRLPDGSPLPPLFNFSSQELKGNEHLKSRLIPPSVRHLLTPENLAELELN